MIMSKKTFERMVEEEVHKRMNAIDERRWVDERFCRIEREMDERLNRMSEALMRLDERVNGNKDGVLGHTVIRF
jgi:glucan phosphorylase